MPIANDKTVQVAAAQINISIGDKIANLSKCLNYIQLAAGQQVELLVFPECTLTGYVFNSFEEAFQLSEPVPGESIHVLEKTCREYHISAVVGLLERDGDRLYNTAVLVTPDGVAGKYRKTHTLCLGVDRYISQGEELPVFSISQGKVAILICYDLRFPETTRIVSLRGAQVILNPTCLPKGADVFSSFFNQARASENRVFLISANRIGVERDVQFMGRSQIIDSFGRIIAQASENEEELLKAEIAPCRADSKHVVIRPGEYEYDAFGDRRPELYEDITGHQ